MIQERLGESLTLSPNDFGDSLLDSTVKGKKMQVDHMGRFDESYIDRCEIYYSSLVSLEIRGILHISNINHLKCVPDSFLAKEEYLMNVIKTLVKKQRDSELLLEKLPKKFSKHVGRELLKYYNFYNDFGLINTQLFQKYPEHFEITLDMKPKLRVKEGELFAWKYPVKFPESYFESMQKNPVNATMANINDIGDGTDNPIVIECCVGLELTKQICTQCIYPH
eukprot:TRINITY_DN11958_c0_g1_i6.p1 TRINITY_DN11958_c0_g1~~TRINITY_DN11958_c0_g1_i6.p1  ORF type:complete len:223 (-),score=57.27 TRINITY_DN11958_c0_g1_i6:121-789(-)